MRSVLQFRLQYTPFFIPLVNRVAFCYVSCKILELGGSKRYRFDG